MRSLKTIKIRVKAHCHALLKAGVMWKPDHAVRGLAHTGSEVLQSWKSCSLLLSNMYAYKTTSNNYGYIIRTPYIYVHLCTYILCKYHNIAFNICSRKTYIWGKTNEEDECNWQTPAAAWDQIGAVYTRGCHWARIWIPLSYYSPD